MLIQQKRKQKESTHTNGMVERHRYRQHGGRKHYVCDLINQSNQLLFVDKCVIIKWCFRSLGCILCKKMLITISSNNTEYCITNLCVFYNLQQITALIEVQRRRQVTLQNLLLILPPLACFALFWTLKTMIQTTAIHANMYAAFACILEKCSIYTTLHPFLITQDVKVVTKFT